MRRLGVLLVTVIALAVPAVSAAATTHDSFTFDQYVELCNGDTLHVTGTIFESFTATATPSGGFLVAEHFQPQDVIGVDQQTGTIFHAVGLTREITISTPPGGGIETFVNQFHLQATQGAQSYIVSDLFRTTVTPAGTVTASFNFVSTTC